MSAKKKEHEAYQISLLDHIVNPCPFSSSTPPAPFVRHQAALAFLFSNQVLLSFHKQAWIAVAHAVG